MIKKLSEREHIRQRPNMYIGAVDATKSMEYITDGDKIVYREVQVVPGLIKIINEIIDNSVDVAIKTNFKSSNLIEVNIDAKKFSVEDNGAGIPIKKNEDGHYLPELCWNHARAGSNFEDDANRTQIGMNGVGSYATACFSKQFVGATDDGTQQYTIKISNGAESFVESLNKSQGSTGTLVSVYPDLEMFGLTEIDELIIKQRLINLSMSFPEITFKFNKKKINVNTFKKYVSMFNPVSEIFENDKIRFAILPNDSDDFKQFSYVNGLKIPDGGIHIDQISYNIVNGIRDKLVKKYKTIKPGDIKNKLMIVAFVQGMPNTKFSSQSKEKLTNSIKEFNEFAGDIPYDKIVAKLLKTPDIIEPITELYRAKEEIARRKELSKMEKTKKKPKSEKFMQPVGPWTNCFLAEGDCLHEETEIVLADGSTKKIKDLTIYDYVVTADGTTQKIKSNFKSQ
jgi:DNA gyrase/topoisomerase IV subunit B